MVDLITPILEKPSLSTEFHQTTPDILLINPEDSILIETESKTPTLEKIDLRSSKRVKLNTDTEDAPQETFYQLNIFLPNSIQFEEIVEKDTSNWSRSVLSKVNGKGLKSAFVEIIKR